MAFERIITQRDVLLADLPHVTPLSYDEYVNQGGYQSLDRVVQGLKPEDILSAVRASGLRGRGGGGFPTAKKWELVSAQKDPVRYLCVNGAEDEPGTFKDRYLVRSNPHQLIEGAALAAFTIGASEGYLYINGHYKEEIQYLEAAMDEANDRGHLGHPLDRLAAGINLRVVKSPGTYVAGEETALLAVIEGGDAKPKVKPPYYPSVHGLFGKPTVVNNVETLCNIPSIVHSGGDSYKKRCSGGTMIFTLTGDVLHEGLYERPFGTSLRALIESDGGQDAALAKPKAVFPGGPSNPILPWYKTDIPLDFDALKAAGSGLGTGAVMVISEKRCMLKTAITCTEFFARESCGQCPPCFLGLENLAGLLRKIDSGHGSEEDLIQIDQVCGMIKGRGYCYLLTGGVLAVESILQYFRDEFVSHIHNACCPFE